MAEQKPQGPTLKGLIIFLKVAVPALAVALCVAFVELQYVHLVSPWYHEEYGDQYLAIFIAVGVTLWVFATYLDASTAKLKRILKWSLIAGLVAIAICFAAKYPFLDYLDEPARKYVRDIANGLALVSYQAVYAAFASVFTCAFVLLYRRGALVGRIEPAGAPQPPPGAQREREPRS